MIVGVERCPQGRSHAAERNRLIRPDVPARRGGRSERPPPSSEVHAGTRGILRPKPIPDKVSNRLRAALHMLSRSRRPGPAACPPPGPSGLGQYVDDIPPVPSQSRWHSSWTADTAPRGRRRTSESSPPSCSAGSPPPKRSASTIDPRTRPGGILRPPGSRLDPSPSCPAPSPSASRTSKGAAHDVPRAQPQACAGVQGNQAKRQDGPALDS